VRERRPPWAWLFFVQLALVGLASALATAGLLPTDFLRAPADKLGHLLMFGGLSFLGVAFFGPTRRWRVIAVLAAGATLEELLQGFSPLRSFDLGDLAMNLVGIIVGNLAFGAAVRARARPAPPHP
jgi:VanZ family protein